MALSKKDKQGYALIGAVFAVAVALFIAKIASGDKPKAQADGCAGDVTNNTVIVLDHSEKITDQTRTEIAARALAHVQKRVQTNERVTVFNISEASKKALAPAFSRCKPPTDGNRMIENVKHIEKSYKRDFIEPLTSALSTPPVDAPESPLGQALIDISLSQHLRGQRNSLLVFSDLMENTPRFSLYSCSDPANTVGRFRESRRGAMERPKFVNTSVQLNVVPRTDLPKASLKCRDALWLWFFGDNEGGDAKVSIDFLPGA